MMVLAGVLILGPVMLQIVLTGIVAHRQGDKEIRQRAVGGGAAALLLGGLMLAFSLWLLR